MNEYYASIFPQSTYRRLDGELENREVRRMHLDVPDLSSEPVECRRELAFRIQSTMLEIVMALGLHSKMKPADQSRILNRIGGLVGIECNGEVLPESSQFLAVWERISEGVINHIKVQLMSDYAGDILRAYSAQINKLVGKYTRFLPPHVADSERDDLKTIAQLEFIETLKIWNPNKGKDVWPIAYSRINGAMKDHIRYITKADPSRFYDWITDAAGVFLSVNRLADFETQIENSHQLKLAMASLSPREQKIVSMYVVDDMTFMQIGERLGISESQISRVYKKAVERIRKTLIARA